MHMPFLNFSLSVATLLLKTLLSLLTVLRKLVRRLPCFVLYTWLNLLQGVLWWTYLRFLPTASWEAYVHSTLAQGVVFAARAAAGIELCHRVLKPYKGVWGAAWRLVAIVSAVLAILAGVMAVRDHRWIFWFVTSLERGLELTLAVALITLLSFAAYYRIRFPSPARELLVGLTVVSIFQVAFDTFLRLGLAHLNAFKTAYQLFFQAILVLWIATLWKPLPPEGPAPLLLEHGVYAETVPEMNERLRKLNDRLAEFLRFQGR